ncbi:hypothetical protein PMAYCL1PPCAC_16013 [Pristionchus mayeri]|uniref:Uncharacterized protein n=1 Tax=Pristionchus mayeri TaxID=1317129 RepID=A0AAN5CK36_9BILA|nr:hypothetical protein PMAYCL1PPCAC_16011 [Pristionchus mayeri]GMR45818.1 hypothetical protein PMAYCL1PPCAC_16013 [Pristionchus mayeri]
MSINKSGTIIWTNSFISEIFISCFSLVLLPPSCCKVTSICANPTTPNRRKLSSNWKTKVSFDNTLQRLTYDDKYGNDCYRKPPSFDHEVPSTKLHPSNIR